MDARFEKKGMYMLMLNYNVSCDEISCHINTLLSTVETLNPKIIYLSSENVSERLHKARISRNEIPPSSEHIQFWEERKK